MSATFFNKRIFFEVPKRNCQMKLLTTEITRKLLAKGAKRNQDHAPVVKFFNPCGSATWLISEMDPEEPDLLFGLCGIASKKWRGICSA
jgi:hypothetical protein